MTPELVTIKQFVAERKGRWPSESALRALILKASWQENNFQSAFIRVGRRVLVDTNKFWECVQKMNPLYCQIKGESNDSTT